MGSKTQSYFRIAIFLGLVVAVAAGVALIFSLLVLQPGGHIGSYSRSSYELLNLSPEELERVDGVYARFETEREALLGEFHRLQGELAGILQEEESYSPRVVETVKQLHVVHADLQKVSIQRFFAVLEVLPAEKEAELRQLMAAALSQPE